MAFRTNKVPVLQTKSASGAVATFNTALAMPLASCNIGINAWQEGSGDPSPVNIRPIHGFREVNTYQRAVNLWDEQWACEKKDISETTGAIIDATYGYFFRSKNFIPVKPNTSVYNFNLVGSGRYRFFFYDVNQNYISFSSIPVNSVINIPANAYYMLFRFTATEQTIYEHNISINYPSTDTDYHAYTGNTYPIQLGQEVYGAEVDVVSGILTITRQIVDLGSLTYTARGNSVFSSSKLTDAPEVQFDILCSEYEVKQVNSSQIVSYDKVISSVPSYNRQIIMICDTDHANDDATTFKTAMNGVQLVYELAEPFDIQLTPTQIETLIGNNTIFADTGDIDLTYKDLDIAKRGNFREVFRLPS